MRSVGSFALIACGQYFVAELVVASAWNDPDYSWSVNFISDLGMTECLRLPDRAICSPRHALMNTSLLLQGVLVLLAVTTLARQLGRWARGVPAVLLVTHSVGLFLVGLFPGSAERVTGTDPPGTVLHTIGAVLAILAGNLAAVTTGVVLIRRRCRPWGVWSVALGGIGLVAALLSTHTDLGLGQGGMERLAADPIPLWLCTTGVYLALRGRSTSRLTVEDQP